MLVFLSELIGTAMLIILGDGVVANVLLNKSGMKGGGSVQITLAWGLAVLVPVIIFADSSGALFNPALAVALAAEYPLPAVCVDCGTAVTLEVVDQNRVFRGGAIAPGRKLMRNALSAGTAQLPEVPLFSEFPVTVGVDTQSSIAFGIDRGIIGLVRELIGCAAAQYGNDGKITVVFTGGDAAWFSAHFPESFTAPADFTLRGLLKVTEK